MMCNISDSLKAISTIEQARRGGDPAQHSPARRVPVIRTGYWGWTLEATVFGGTTKLIEYAARFVFYRLDEQAQRAFTFTPMPGQWVERAKFWSEQLKPLLPPVQHYTAMIALVGWFRHCLS